MTGHISVNGSLAGSDDGGGGDKISTNTLLRWLVAASGSLVILFFTRWLSHIDSELDLVKASITEIRKESAIRNEAWARFEGKIDSLLREKSDARR